MELNTAYKVAHANKRRETQAIALQGNTAYNNYSTQDNGYTMVENNGRETFASTNNTAYAINREVFTTETNSTSNVLNNTKKKRQGCAKNECDKKWFAILSVLAIAFLSLLLAVAALVYTNIALKNKEDQSTTEQLNNQSSTIEPFNLGTINNPANSCSDIPQDRPSGEYWITTDSTSSPVQVYCDMNRTSCSCNTAGRWMRVANLDMTNPNQNCPEELMLVTREEPPLRTCGRMERRCTSTTYSTYGVEYSNVCGRIIAYQDSTPDAFDPYFDNRALSIDDGYVDGVSLTHGHSPRQHIWTFANALHEDSSMRTVVCPCTRPDRPRPYTGVVPPFIGQDYFCETGSRQLFNNGIFYADDLLWDGQGCGGTSTCCEFNNPPWFCKQLPQPTTDDIELRICADQPLRDEDTPIEITEIYIR
ncbi:uncharacterized protein LOC135336168 [Halichondria panicea]|uniref:uncharacterized protein LOC135336168 n=1 Tax=Halichondria panicea TaxID=6063 RepID=UPI00312B9C0E